MHLQDGIIVRMARSRAQGRVTLAQRVLRVAGFAARALVLGGALWVMGLIVFGAYLSA